MTIDPSMWPVHIPGDIDNIQCSVFTHRSGKELVECHYVDAHGNERSLKTETQGRPDEARRMLIAHMRMQAGLREETEA